MDTKHLIDFSKPIIDAAKTIFETMIFTKIEIGNPEIKNDAVTRGDVSAIIGIAGKFNKDGQSSDVKGMLVLSWPKETYIKTANAMLQENHKEFNKEIADAGAEIVNMIFGNAKRKLSDMGYTFELSIPSTIEGKNHSLNYPPGTTALIIKIISAHGPFFVEFCYN